MRRKRQGRSRGMYEPRRRKFKRGEIVFRRNLDGTSSTMIAGREWIDRDGRHWVCCWTPNYGRKIGGRAAAHEVYGTGILFHDPKRVRPTPSGKRAMVWVVR